LKIFSLPAASSCKTKFYLFYAYFSTHTQTCPLPHQPLPKNVLGKFLLCCAEKLLPDTVLCLPHKICEKKGKER